MNEPLQDALSYLATFGLHGFIAQFWLVLAFDIPRYLAAFLSLLLVRPRPRSADPQDLTVSILIAGHSEGGPVLRTIAALREQSRPPDEIVLVSDGSTDGMAAVAAALQRKGTVRVAHATGLRAGKSAAVNLALRSCTGDIVVVVDCDCSFDRHAIRNILRCFADPGIDAACGNVVVRNPRASVTTAVQALEYLISISLGKQALDRWTQVSCISGAFGAFRRRAMLDAGGLDAGGGEDLDLTLRLRRAGRRIAFAEDALCYTDVPVTPGALMRQRMRWERDAVRLRFRKHGEVLNPRSPHFSLAEVAHEAEFLLFNVIGALALPVYVAWLFIVYGTTAPSILIAAQALVLALDLITALLAAVMTPGRPGRHGGLLLWVPAYSLYNGVFMRLFRAVAYIEEWVFRSSYRDQYVPAKVHARRA